MCNRRVGRRHAVAGKPRESIDPWLGEGPAGQPAAHPGRAVYEQYCQACHAVPGTRAPALSALQEMSAQTLKFTLTEGVMQAQGSPVPKESFGDLIGYLAAAGPAGGDWVAAMMCKPDQRNVDLDQPVSLSMFGVRLSYSVRAELSRPYSSNALSAV